MSFCFLYNVVSEKHSVQNSPRGGGGGLLPAQGLNVPVIHIIDVPREENTLQHDFGAACSPLLLICR